MSPGKSEIASDFLHLNVGPGGKTHQVDGGCIAYEYSLSGDMLSGNRRSYKLFMTGIRFCFHSTLHQHLLIGNEQ